MIIWHFWQDFQTWLKSWPSAVLTVVLLIAALTLVLIALRGSATQKALASAYVFLP